MTFFFLKSHILQEFTVHVLHDVKRKLLGLRVCVALSGHRLDALIQTGVTKRDGGVCVITKTYPISLTPHFIWALSNSAFIAKGRVCTRPLQKLQFIFSYSDPCKK